MKILTVFLFLIFSFPPQITNFYNNKTFIFFQNSILAREVSQKSLFALPCCMGSIVCLLPMQRGNAKSDFCNTSPARIIKINKIALPSYGFDVSARKSPKANRQQIVTFLPQVRSGRVFQIAKNLTKRFKNVCNTQEISTITT